MTAKILIIEDEPHISSLLVMNLKAVGYDVDSAGDGPTALAKVQDSEEGYDLLVLDIMLPGMSGYAVCEELRNKGHMMPILILSARTLAEDRTRGFNVGANQYMSKPLDLDEFLARVKNLLKMTRRAGVSEEPQNDQVYQFGNASINFQTFECLIDGQQTTLTSLEMKLLRYFIRRENQIITRDELQENVWEIPGDVNTRAVDQFIRRLRKLFESDPANPRHFLTLRNIGYRFVK